ncbi:DNA helicase Rep [Marinibactrum halimedae]|uniref:ATP-dependent DNA helicase Rep n=1 Tax=Marinibactrum halimedae TaxID=1444977 RepID=A0AA37T915_9GAMM|nr:DNA helicase Rep [Marinibactrum halimedae]MCD9458281.1 DNA helicase Rep [Marinibactrum halimedae]GLS27092.1 ATP-dependent DNA helicase Rep [Marinibactrum halimedae]
MNNLNSRQKQAVSYIDGPCLVLAGAGSGKTSVITRKIAYLVDECGYTAHHIAALTFTNKAAREMKERVSALLKGGRAKGLTVSTFHNLGLNIIRKEHKALGFKPGFSIFDAEDAKSLLRELMLKDGDLDSDQLDLTQHHISNWKNDLVTPEHAMSRASSDGEYLMALVYQRYNQALRAYNAVDFDDLILLPVQLFSEQPNILDSWKRRIRYLLVDEYQDTNNSQYRLVKQLVGDRAALTVVGDDDQSIYAWRGARPENMTQLKVDFPQLEVIKLEQNYRSTQRILKVANHLIAHNPHEFEKTLWSEKAIGEPIRIIKCTNEDSEAERVATEILNQKMQRQVSYKDFAILYRGNHQARLMELKLQQHQIPYSMSGGTSFFARTEIKDIMAYFRLIINPDDDNAFLRIINTPRRQIGTSTLETLGNYATTREISMFQACQEIGLQQQLAANTSERIQRFCHWMEKLTIETESEKATAALRQLINDIDYEGWLHQNASSAKVAERRLENVHYLIESIAKMLEPTDPAREPLNLKDAIAKLVLMDLLDRQEEAEVQDQVQMMTLHASKGLEFPHVFILGMEEDILPHRTSIEEDNIEEERRLAYVGITRAEKTLTLTLAGKRKQYGEVLETSMSRFIDELPENDLEQEGFGQYNPEKNQARGRATLDNLKNLFDDL